ncbi:MAG: tetratricopeptide repeat protein, partial [Planctomycetales bacterium]|nr:tetratricopeptide repeat protein [Planctomycetales bacterium]
AGGAPEAPAPAPAPPPRPPPLLPISRRLSRLSPAAREVLAAAATLGPRVPESQLRAVVPDPSRGLAELSVAGLLVESSIVRDPAWEFPALYLFEAALAATEPEKVRKSRKAALRVAQSGPSDGLAGLERLAVLSHACGRGDEAVDAQVGTAVAAAEEHHLELAEAHLRDALAALGERSPKRPWVRFHLARVLGGRGQLDEAIEHLTRALEELPARKGKAAKKAEA